MNKSQLDRKLVYGKLCTVGDHISCAINTINEISKSGQYSSRELSIVKTKLQEAQMWLSEISINEDKNE